MPIPVTATWSSNFSSRAMGRTDRIRSRSSRSSGNAGGGSPLAGRTTAARRPRPARRRRAPACPRAHPRASHPTMLVVTRIRGSSSMATTATEYGAGISGDHCWKFVVQLWTTPSPDTGRTSSWSDRQRRQRGPAGCCSDSARGAVLEPQPAVGARGPVEAIPIGHQRQDACHHPLPPPSRRTVRPDRCRSARRHPEHTSPGPRRSASRAPRPGSR